MSPASVAERIGVLFDDAVQPTHRSVACQRMPARNLALLAGTRPRLVAAALTSRLCKQHLHLLDLLLLAGNDAFTQRLDPSVVQIGLPAHEDRTRVVRNH